MIKITDLTQFTKMCPSQWEGHTSEEKTVYIRYRYGKLSVYLSRNKTNNFKDAVEGDEILNVKYGDDLDSYLSYDELKKITFGTIELPEELYK